MKKGNGMLVEVLVVYANQLEEVVMSERMFNEFQQTLGRCLVHESHCSTHTFAKRGQLNQMREALMKGYVEMSNINLSICSECLHLEYEAEHIVERLVTGG